MAAGAQGAHTHLKTETCKQQHTKKSRADFRLKMNMFCCGWRRGTRLRWRVRLFFISTLGTHCHICPVYENDIDTTQHLHVQKIYTVASKKIQPHTNVGHWSPCEILRECNQGSLVKKKYTQKILKFFIAFQSVNFTLYSTFKKTNYCGNNILKNIFLSVNCN